MIAWPCHYDFFVRSARSPTFLWSFKPDNSSIWPQWSGEQQFDSQSRIPHRERRRSSNNQCKHRTSGSTQFYKQSQGPRLSSETQPDSYPPHRCSHILCCDILFYGIQLGRLRWCGVSNFLFYIYWSTNKFPPFAKDGATNKL